jgi:hypothetical protein
MKLDDSKISLKGNYINEQYLFMLKFNYFSDFYRIKKLKEQYEGYEIVSVHIRRGDNMENNQEGLIKAYEKNGLYFTYFNKAKEVFKNKKVKFLIFTGGARGDENNNSDIKWCKENFNFLDNVIYCENNEDYEDLYLMSLCNDNIIANSSFSWWGAWLNKNKTKKVISPKKWFGPSKSNFITDDIYCEKWIVI